MYTGTITAIFDNIRAAVWAKEANNLYNQPGRCFVYLSKQADGTTGTLMAMRGSLTYDPLHSNLPPQDADMIDDIRWKFEDDEEIRCPK